MLHMLWLILKIILIVLAVALGLLLLLAGLLLFCPVRYEGQGVKKEASWKKAEGQATVSWLFRGISYTIYRKGEENGTTLRVLGISIEKLKDKRKKKKKKPSILDEELSERETPEQIEELSEVETSEQIEEEEPSALEPAEKKEVSQEKPFTEKEAVPKEPLSQEKPKKKEKASLSQRLMERWKRICEKIKATQHSLKAFRRNVDWWKAYIHHPRVRAAASLIWEHGKGLLKHILPTKIWGDVTFGFSDPSITGRVLGLVGMSFPLHKNAVTVIPRFDGENILEGELNLKGRIYGIVLLKTAITIYFNKNVKYAIKRAQHRKHKEE